MIDWFEILQFQLIACRAYDLVTIQFQDERLFYVSVCVVCCNIFGMFVVCCLLLASRERVASREACFFMKNQKIACRWMCAKEETLSIRETK